MIMSCKANLPFGASDLGVFPQKSGPKSGGHWDSRRVARVYELQELHLVVLVQVVKDVRADYHNLREAEKRRDRFWDIKKPALVR